MKGRESGMPDQDVWEAFFNPGRILERLRVHAQSGDIVEFGCGYGTFTIAAARITPGLVYAIDIDPEMIAMTESRARAAGLNNVRVIERDFIAQGSGLPGASVGCALLFNILHVENPLDLLSEARRVLGPSGRVAVIHWNYDPTTPRGPSLEIRPKPAQMARWLEDSGFILETPVPVDLPPYHYGLVGHLNPL